MPSTIPPISMAANAEVIPGADRPEAAPATVRTGLIARKPRAAPAPAANLSSFAITTHANGLPLEFILIFHDEDIPLELVVFPLFDVAGVHIKCIKCHTVAAFPATHFALTLQASDETPKTCAVAGQQALRAFPASQRDASAPPKPARRLDSGRSGGEKGV